MNLHKNASGYTDHTAGKALENMVSIERKKEIDDIAVKLVLLIKMLLDIWGFELLERVQIKHKKTGKEYK